MARYIGNGVTARLEYEEERGVRKEEHLDLDFFYSFWRGQFFERLMRLFVYDGWMPYPQRELEKRLLRAGVAAEVYDEQAGLMVTYGSLHGITEYYDVFKYLTYANPAAKGGTKTIGKNVAVVYNNSTMLSVNPFIDRYASLAAHIDLSIRCSAINLRAQNVLLADNEATRDTMNEWYKKLYRGDTMAILDKGLFVPSDSVIPTGGYSSSSLTDEMTALTELMRSFYRDIGVRFAKDKKSNMIQDEVTSDEQMLLFNIDDMLENRKEFCWEHNRIFESRFDEINSKSLWGYKFEEYIPLTVKLNPIFEKIGGSDDEKDD